MFQIKKEECNVGDGTVFEIAKTSTGYASTPTTIFSFNDTDGASPVGSPIANAVGIFSERTDAGGPGGSGTVFELSGTGFRGAERGLWRGLARGRGRFA